MCNNFWLKKKVDEMPRLRKDSPPSVKIFFGHGNVTTTFFDAQLPVFLSHYSDRKIFYILWQSVTNNYYSSIKFSLLGRVYAITYTF